jgi:hypothetical protein
MGTKDDMSDVEYLENIIAANSLEEGSAELDALRAARKRVEATLRAELGNDPVIRYGGSHGKGTMVTTSYDLDLLCYFPRDADDAGDTVEALWTAVKEALEKEYAVDEKRSALRVRDDDGDGYLHIDVVPGRFIDESSGDVFIHQNDGDKKRLKTNPETHLAHVRESGVRDAIKLSKIWRDRYAVPVKTFVLELLVIKLLDDLREDALDDQLRHVLTEFRDHSDDMSIVDPANSGNDLGPLLDRSREELRGAADSALLVVERQGWRALFGPLPEEGEATKSKRAVQVAGLAARDRARVRPWGS